MPDLATQPDCGRGPYGVEHDEADSFYYLTLHGTRTGKNYPLGKTAYRTARKLNDEFPITGNLGGPADDIPPDAPFDDPRREEDRKAIERSKSNPKNPKGSTASKSNPPDPKLPSWKRSKGTPDKREGAKIKPAPKPAKRELKDTAGHSTVIFQGTREEWLNAFVAAARPVFKSRGYELPDKVRVSIGFTGARGGGAILGACWHEAASGDGTREIFVVPTLDDSSRIAGIVTHELCHTLFGPEEKHGSNFRKAALSVGLEGKMTATTEGAGWNEWADPILAALGPLPHAALDPSLSGRKKQTTRLVKCLCTDCGFTFRATAKWVSGKELQCPDPDCGGDVEVASEGE